MRRLGLLWLAVAALAAPQTAELPRWVLDLSRIKRHLRTNFERLPNYVCLQTINRSQSTRRDWPMRPFDVLRLEVAQVEGHELFALEGDKQFSISDPSSLISRGAIGTGSFSGTARNLFVHDAARVTAFAEETDGGRKIFRFDYEIPQMLHPQELRIPSKSAWVGERGTFFIDPESMDVREINLQATDIPPQLGIMEVTTDIKYERMQIGETDVLLPKIADMLMLRYDGTRIRNVTRFSSCRAYVTESTISFGPAFTSDSKVTYGKGAAPPAADRPPAKK